MRFIHTADLHLDSVMGSRFSVEQAAQRRRELLLNFGRLADYAGAHGVRAVLIAGDLFDTDAPSPDSLSYVEAQMKAHPDIDFLVLGGNHSGEVVFEDPPPNYKTFRSHASSVVAYRYDNVVVSGSENNACYSALSLNHEDINILVLHGQISDTVADLSLINPKFYAGRNIDYLALGHLHTARRGKLDDRGIWAYSGCLEGRGFDETGEKGFLLLDSAERGLTCTFVPFSVRTVHVKSVDIGLCYTQRDIEVKTEAAIAGIPSQDIVRILLRGMAEPTMHKDPKMLCEKFRSRFFYLEVKDESSLSLRPEQYEHDISLRGEFVRTVMRSDLPREEQERVIAAGLRALSGEEIDL